MIKDTTNKIINKLTQQEKEEGNLPLLLDFYKKLVIVQAEAQANIGDIEPTIDVDAISLRLNQGQPLVAFEELAIDWPLLKDVFSRVAEVFAQYPQLFGDSPKRLTVPAAGRLLTKNAVKAWYEGRTLPPSLREGLSGNLVQAILQATLHPFLKKHALALIQYIGDDSWRRNYCPVCGSIPDFSYLETEVAGRAAVLDALGETGSPRAVNALERLAKAATRREDREGALRALRRLASEGSAKDVAGAALERLGEPVNG